MSADVSAFINANGSTDQEKGPGGSQAEETIVQHTIDGIISSPPKIIHNRCSFKDEIKEKSAGEWCDLVVKLTGVDRNFFTGSHLPCPRCAGTDRFRAFNDFDESGGVICNKCGTFADGIATISWLKDWSFKETLDKLADELGIKPKKKSSDPARHLEFQPWNESIVEFFCTQKPPIRPEAILAIGGRLARYRKSVTVIAIPVLNSSFKPCGWRIFHISGGKQLPVYNKNGYVRSEASLLTAGSKHGLIAPLERLKTAKRIWKVEGEADLMAFLSMVDDPNEVAICNSCGAAEKPLPWIVSLFEGKNAVVVGDADEPGQKGAKLWSQTLGPAAKSVVNVQLPYPIQPTKGKDVRDFLNERSVGQLIALAGNTSEFQPEVKDDGSVSEVEVDFPIQKRHLELLEIEVMFEDEDGRVKIYSKHLRKTSTIRNVGKMTESEIIQYCGPPAQMVLTKDVQDESTEMSVDDARKAIALEASKLRHSQLNECGQGIWMGRDLEGEPTGSIILVGAGEAARYNGDQKLREILVPRIDGLVLDMSSRNEWYEFDRLNELISKAQDPNWRKGVLEKGFNFFGGWRWQHPHGHEIATAMCVASWIQSCWTWRPQMAIVGESNSGKSYFFQALEKMFQGLVLAVSKPTEAGVRQEVGISSQLLLVDEFEHDRNRAKVLELIRTSSRGTTVARGTPGGKSIRFGLKHIAWVAAIEAGIEKQADVNRFIQLELLRARKEDAGKLQLPSAAWLHELGQEMLAVAIVIAAKAAELASQGKETKIGRVDQRLVESFAVPAAVMASSIGNDEAVRPLLERFVSFLDEDEQEPITDHEALLQEILNSQVTWKGETYSASQILSCESLRNDPHISSRLDSCGLKMNSDGSLLIYHKMVSKNLNRDLQGRFDLILQRIQGARKVRARIAGTRPYLIEVPREIVAQVGINTSGNKKADEN